MEQATSFKPPQGMAGIYVIREGGMLGAAVAWQYAWLVNELLLEAVQVLGHVAVLV
jgi:hypothetical protein